ncbi:hypothetical protein LINGRAPRIM_LOCUS401 [Linum grandiflorum]
MDNEVNSPNADIDEANQSSAQKGGGDIIEVSTTSSGTRSTRHESLPNTLIGFLPFANRPNPSPKPLTSGEAPFIILSVNIFSQSQDMAPSSSVPIVNTLLEDHDGLTYDHPMSPLLDTYTSAFGSSDECRSSPQTSGVLANLNELASHANLPPFLPHIVQDPSAPNVTVVRQDKTTIEDELDFLASLGSQFSTPPPSTLSVYQTIQDALVRAKDFLSLPLDVLLSSLETGWPSDAFELLFVLMSSFHSQDQTTKVHTAHDKTKSLISTDEIAFKKEFIIQARADSMSKLAGLKAIVEDLLSTICR